MARLPTILSEARIPSVGPDTRVDVREIPYLVNSGLPALGDKASEFFGTVAKVEKAARDENAITTSVADVTAKLDQYRIDLEKDPDYAGREAKFQAEATRLRGEALPALSNAASLDFDRRFQGLYAGQAHSIRTQARHDEIQSQIVDLDAATNKQLETALNAPNRLVRNATLDEIKLSIERARDTGVLSAAAAKKFHKDTLGKFDELTVSRVMRKAPGQALALLNDDAATPNLDPLRREQLKIHAQSRLEQMSALAKADARDKVADVLKSFEGGNLNPPNKDEAYRAASRFPDLQKHLAHAEYIYGSAAEFNAKDLPERNSIVASMIEDQAAGRNRGNDTVLLGAYQKLNSSLVHAYTTDFAATALQRNAVAAEAMATSQRDLAGFNEPDLATRLGAGPAAAAPMDAAQRFRASLAEMDKQGEKDGIPLYLRTLLPKQSAVAIEANINQLQGQQRLDLIRSLKDQYGPEYFPRVYRQLDAGKHLPADVKILAGGDLSNADGMLVQRAIALTPHQREEMVPDKDVRASVKSAVDAAGAAARETMARVPDGGQQKYADLAITAHAIADYLYGTKRVSSADAAATEAWKIVYGNNFASAGSVAIPKRDGQPVIAPDMVSAYQEYARKALLPGLNLEAPPPDAATARLSDATRIEMRRRTLATFGYFVADGEDRGMVMLDGNGEVARDANGRALRWSWNVIQSDARFLDWYTQRGKQDLPPIGTPVTPRTTTPHLLLPTAPEGSRNRIEQVPAYRRNKDGGGDGANPNLGGGGEADTLPLDNEQDWQKFYKEKLVPVMPYAQKYPHALRERDDGVRQLTMDFPRTDEGTQQSNEWRDYLMKRFPDGGSLTVNFGGFNRRIFNLPRKTGM